MTKQEIMVLAHKLAKQMVGDYQVRLALALRQAWREARNESDVPFPHHQHAEELAAYIRRTNSDMQVKVWTVGDRSRVYVTQSLSRGRHREIGFVEINDCGESSYEAGYIRSTVRDWAVRVVA